MESIQTKITKIFQFLSNQNILSDEQYTYVGFLDFLEKNLIYSSKGKKDWHNIIGPCQILHSIQKAKKDYQSMVNNFRIINDLEIIGLFQTLYIEQDALKNLLVNITEETTYTDFGKRYVDFNTIRYLRNAAFGHPSEKKINGNKKGEEVPITVHIYSIYDNKKHIIHVLNWKSNAEFEEFELKDILTKHNKYVNDILDNIIDVLNTKFIAFNLQTL